MSEGFGLAPNWKKRKQDENEPIISNEAIDRINPGGHLRLLGSELRHVVQQAGLRRAEISLAYRIFNVKAGHVRELQRRAFEAADAANSTRHPNYVDSFYVAVERMQSQIKAVQNWIGSIRSRGAAMFTPGQIDLETMRMDRSNYRMAAIGSRRQPQSTLRRLPQDVVDRNIGSFFEPLSGEQFVLDETRGYI